MWDGAPRSAEPDDPIRQRPDLVAWIGRPHAAGTYHALYASEARRSVAARPSSRLLTGTSARSEPALLTVPAWGTDKTSGTPGQGLAAAGLETDRLQSLKRCLPQPQGLQPNREVVAAAVKIVKPSTSEKTDAISVTSAVRPLDYRGHREVRRRLSQQHAICYSASHRTERGSLASLKNSFAATTAAVIDTILSGGIVT